MAKITYCQTQNVFLQLFQQNLVNAVNNLVEKDELVAWNRMKEERREHTITKLLHAVEESALTLANNYRTPTELQIKAADMGETVRNTFAHAALSPT